MTEPSSEDGFVAFLNAGWFIYDAEVDTFMAGPTRDSSIPAVYIKIEGHLMLDDGETKDTFTFLMKPSYAMWLAAQLMAASMPKTDEDDE